MGQRHDARWPRPLILIGMKRASRMTSGPVYLVGHDLAFDGTQSHWSASTSVHEKNDGMTIEGNNGQQLPDPACTPGTVNPAVSQANIADTICKSGWTSTVRPSGVRQWTRGRWRLGCGPALPTGMPRPGSRTSTRYG